MDSRKVTISLSLVTLGLGLCTTTANAAMFTPLPGYSDDDFARDINSGAFVEEAIAEGRIGDDGMATYELDIQDVIPPDTFPSPNDPNNFPQAQFDWVNGEEVDFELSFDGSRLTYTVGVGTEDETVLSSVDILDEDFDVNGILLRTRTTDTSGVTLKNLELDGMQSMSDLVSSDGEVEYLRVSGIDNEFTLTGTSIFDWTGTRPRNSQLAFQIKVGNFNEGEPGPSAEVPEPASISLLSLGVLGTFMARRRRK